MTLSSAVLLSQDDQLAREFNAFSHLWYFQLLTGLSGENPVIRQGASVQEQQVQGAPHTKG
jgi:hypothetical protein